MARWAVFSMLFSGTCALDLRLRRQKELQAMNLDAAPKKKRKSKTTFKEGMYKHLLEKAKQTDDDIVWFAQQIGLKNIELKAQKILDEAEAAEAIESLKWTHPPGDEVGSGQKFTDVSDPLEEKIGVQEVEENVEKIPDEAEVKDMADEAESNGQPYVGTPLLADHSGDEAGLDANINMEVDGAGEGFLTLLFDRGSGAKFNHYPASLEETLGLKDIEGKPELAQHSRLPELPHRSGDDADFHMEDGVHVGDRLDADSFMEVDDRELLEGTHGPKARGDLTLEDGQAFDREGGMLY